MSVSYIGHRQNVNETLPYREGEKDIHLTLYIPSKYAVCAYLCAGELKLYNVRCLN